MAKPKTKKKLNKARFKKGSPEAKAHMAKIRAKKNGIKKPETDNSGTVSSSSETLVTGSDTEFNTLEELETEELQEQEKELAAELLVGMPTRYEMEASPPDSVHKHLNWEKKNFEKIHTWKEIRRFLNPDDPNAANLENIRPEGEWPNKLRYEVK